MKIAVFGATGATGRHVVAQALDRGLHVVAAVRQPSALLISHPHLTVVRSDVISSESLSAATADTEAVISALGIGASRQPTTVYSAGTANIIAAMRETNSSRLVAVSAAPAAPWELSPFFQRHVLLPMLQRVFGATYDDMRIMERDLEASSADWTVVRPPRLNNKPARGSYRLSTEGPIKGGSAIARADLGRCLLDAATNPDLIGKAAWVAN